MNQSEPNINEDLSSMMDKISALESLVDSLKKKAVELKNLDSQREELSQGLDKLNLAVDDSSLDEPIASTSTSPYPFSLPEYTRYGRQMILEGMGEPGQLKLKNASVLVVGAGGLGCPALQYLGAAGVGKIGIVDHDTVEFSNLHRQILHTENTVGWLKVESAKHTLLASNPHLDITTYPTSLSAENALSLIAPYSLILDCTDLPLTRYLINDACVLLKKTLVSGAALGFHGQVAVYNFGEQGACYRCVWPTVQKREKGGTCEEEGVLGVVTGIIGNLQALEAIKIITDLRNPSTPQTLTIFSALSSPPFRTIKLRAKQPTCRICSGAIKSLEDEDYVTFCGGRETDWNAEGMKSGARRVGVQDLSEALISGNALPSNVVDVRSTAQFSICSIPGSINIPIETLLASPALPDSVDFTKTVYFLCRRGNDSKDAVEAILAASTDAQKGVKEDLLVDVKGGLVAWAKIVDTNFPLY